MAMRFTRQFDQMDCGPACIRMVASHYGKEYPLSYLRSLAHLTREGVSVAGIRDALGEIGIESATFEMTPEQLREKCPLPAILHWEQNHFVVLTKVSRSRWTGRWVSLYMGTRINIHILNDYLTKLLRLPMTFFETKSVGDYQQRIGDHSRLQSFVTQSTVRGADNIVVLRKGRVVEHGTHAELVAARGYYYELIRNQLELPD